MEVAFFSEVLVNIHQTIQQHTSGSQHTVMRLEHPQGNIYTQF